MNNFFLPKNEIRDDDDRFFFFFSLSLLSIRAHPFVRSKGRVSFFFFFVTVKKRLVRVIKDIHRNA